MSYQKENARHGARFSLPIAELPTDERTEREQLAGVGALTLLLHDYGEVKMPVANFIAEGVTLLVGASKIGKSFLMLDLCAKVVCGKPVLGMETEKSPVWYYALEDSPRRIKKRLTQLSGGWVGEDIADLTFVFEAPTVAEGFLPALELKLNRRAAEGKQLPGMIVIDTLQLVRGMTPGSVNAYASDYQFIRQVKETARRFRIAFVLVHHTNKLRNTQDSFERVSGSTGLMGAADSTILIERGRGESNARVSGTGRDIFFDDFDIMFENGLWKRAARTEEESGGICLENDVLAQALALAYNREDKPCVFCSYESLRALCADTFGTTPFSDGRDCARLIARLREPFRKEYRLLLEPGALSKSRRGIRISALPISGVSGVSDVSDVSDVNSVKSVQQGIFPYETEQSPPEKREPFLSYVN